LGMEKSLKMLLSIEYERIQGMMSDGTDERRTTLNKGETDPTKKTGNKFGGLLGRAASGVGGMIGGAYSKVKGGLSGSFGKMLGIGALIIAFKKYPDQIKAAFKKILTFFKSVYDYFTTDDFSFEKFKTDWVNTFYPKMKSVIGDALGWVWSSVKQIVSDFVFGASGDKKIGQDRRKMSKASTAIEEMKSDLTAAGVDLDASIIGGATGNFFVDRIDDTTGVDNLGELDDKSADNLNKQLNRTLQAMRDITIETDGRVQWNGIPDLSNPVGYTSAQLGLSINQILSAIPLIDGFKSTKEQLDAFRLFASAGVTKTTNEVDRELIFDNLKEMTSIRKSLERGPGEKGYSGPGVSGFQTKSELMERFNELQADNKLLGQLSQAEVAAMVSGETSFLSDEASLSGTTGTTANTKTLATQAQIDAKKVRDDNAKLFAEASMNQPGRNITTNLTDQSQTQVINSGLNGFPNNDTVKAVNYKEVGASY